MATYLWNPRQMQEVLALPAGITDCLSVAGPEHLRVLLWFSRRGQQWDAAACAAALQMEPAACESCLRFWAEQSILLDADALPPSADAASVKAPVARAAAVKPVWQEVLAYQQEHREFTAPAIPVCQEA